MSQSVSMLLRARHLGPVLMFFAWLGDRCVPLDRPGIGFHLVDLSKAISAASRWFWRAIDGRECEEV